MRLPVAVLFLGSLLVACAAPDRDSGDDGTDPGDDDPGTGDNCSDAAKTVYTVDADTNHLLTWSGASKTFTDLGVLNCPGTSSMSPFSMSVDRNAAAWILYVDQFFGSSKIMRVDTVNGLACTNSGYNTSSMQQFGMGFSTDSAGGTTDKLFIAGGTEVGLGSSKLANLDTATMSVSQLGTVQGDPELTGTGTAELWGFFPQTSGSRIARLNKTTGAAEQTFNFPQADGQPAAWAFAYWGGDFWVFLQKDGEQNTTVYQVDGETGATIGSTPAPGRRIVGAGVSTCAPTVIL